MYARVYSMGRLTQCTHVYINVIVHLIIFVTFCPRAQRPIMGIWPIRCYTLQNPKDNVTYLYCIKAVGRENER